MPQALSRDALTCRVGKVEAPATIHTRASLVPSRVGGRARELFTSYAMNREKQDSAYDTPGFRVIPVLDDCLLRVMPPVKYAGAHGLSELSNFAQTAAVNGRRLLSAVNISNRASRAQEAINVKSRRVPAIDRAVLVRNGSEEKTGRSRPQAKGDEFR